MYGNKPPAARRLAQFPQQLADGGMVARMKSADAGPATFGSRGLSQLRDMIPKMQAMGYPQQAAAAPAAADPRAAQLQAMIPQVEAMGYKQQPQRLADGGFVYAAKRMMGLTPEDPARAAALAEYKANAEREKAAAKAASAPATAPAPQAAISQYSGMSAMQRREKEQGLADGGMIRGPGTGTSDSIATEAEPGTFIMPADSTKAIGPRVLEQMGKKVPVRLSNGEYEMPPEQVMGLGAAVLEALKDGTHTPVEQEGGMAAQKLASGGMVENDVTRVGNSYSGGNVGGSITVNGQAPAGTNSIVSTPALSPATAPTTPAVAPASPGAAPTAPGVAQASAVAPATTPAPPAPMGWAERNAQRNLQVSASSILDSPERSAAQAALAPPPAVPSPAPVAPAATGFQSAAQRLGTPPSLPQPQLGFQPRRYADGGTVEDERAKLLAQIPTGGPAGWTGGGAAPAPTPVAAAPSSGGGSLSRAAAMVPPPAPVAAPAGPAAAGFQPAAARMASVPQDTGMGFQPGAASAQSSSAGDSLSRRGAADVLADTSSAPQYTAQAPTIRHSGNDWAARKALENAATAASSITANGGRFDETRGRNPASLAYQAAIANDNAQRAAEPAAGLAAMQEASANNRAAMQQRSAAAQALASERGAMDRTLITERGNNTRAGITAQAGLDEARIKAGAAGDKPLNDVQAKALQFGGRMQAAGQTLDKLAAEGVDQPSLWKRGADAVGLGGLANFAQNGSQQQVEQAQRDYINAVLRRESGAAIADSEFANARQQYFPQPGDSAEVKAQKRQNRELAAAGILAEVPNSAQRVGQVRATADANARPAAQPGSAGQQAARSPVPDDVGALLKKYGG